MLSAGVIGTLHDLEEEPLTPFAFIDDGLQQAGCGHVATALAYFVRRPLRLGEVGVVFHESLDHFSGRDEVVVVVFDCLQVADVGDGTDGSATDAAHAFSQDIDCREDLIGMLIEEPVVVVEMRTCQVPVEVLGF